MKIKITLMLLLALVANTIAVSVSAAENSGFDAYTSSVDVLSALEIVDAPRGADDAVTRAEFAEYVIKAMNTETAAMPDGSIADVTEANDHAAAIYAAKQLGLIGEGAFKPDDKISFNAAAQILTSALGYGELAELKGGYPAGYNSCAKSAELTKNVSARGESALNFSDCAIILYNFLNADLYDVDAFDEGNIVRRRENGKNILTENYGFTLREGIIKSAGRASIVPGFDTDTDVITVGADTYRCTLPGAERYLGLDAKIMYDDNDTVRAVYVNPKNKVYRISAEDVNSYSNFRLKTENESGKSKEYRMSYGFTFAKNGRAHSPDSSAFVFDDGYLVLIDTDNDKNIDVVLTYEYRHIVVSSGSNIDGAFYDISGKDSVKLRRENGYWYKLTGRDDEGNSAELMPEDIETGSVLSVCESADGKWIEAYVSTQAVDGTLDAVDEDYVSIDGIKYRRNSYFKKNAKVSIGKSGKFLIDFDGRITDISGSADGEYRYGYVIGVNYSGEDEHIWVRMIDQSGKSVRYSTGEKVKLDGTMYKDDCEPILAKLMTSGKPKYQLIRYRLSAEGQIRAIDTVSDAPATAPEKKFATKKIGDDCLEIFVKNASAYIYGNYNIFIPYGISGQNTVVFQVPKCIADSENLVGADKRLEKYDEKYFKVISPSELESETYLIDMYNMNDKLQPDVVIIYEGDPNQSPTPIREDTAMVVEKVTTALDENDTVTKAVTVWRKGSFRTYTLSEELYSELSKKKGFPKAGDVIRAKFESPTVISGLAIDVSYDTENGVPKMINPGESQIYDVGYCGRLFSVGDGALVLKVETAPGWSASYSGTIKDNVTVFSVRSDTYFARFTPGEGIKEIKASELRPGLAVGNGNASPIVVYSYRNGLKLVVEYVDE